MDVRVQQNMDSLFDNEAYDVEDGNKVWGQMDNFDCNDPVGKKTFCSGLMLFKPKKDHVAGLNAQAKKQGWCWGDQKLIANFFKEKEGETTGRSKGLFPKQVVSWSHGGEKKSMASHMQTTR